MLFVEAFSEMHRILQSEAPASKVWDRGLIAIAQILGKILSMQNNDGSWGPRECAETTAYALLSLVAIKNIPFMNVMKEEIRYAINRGRQAMSLMHDKWAEPHHLWVEKVAYGCTGLSEAYSLAAMKKSNEDSLYNQNERTSETKQAQKILTFAKYFSGCDHLMKMPLSVIKLSVIEGYCYQSGLKALRTQVFPKTQAKERDKYLDYIPIMWTLASNSRHLSSPPEYLFDMMVLSMFIFLVDEYMESHVAQFSMHEMAALRRGLEELHPVPTTFGVKTQVNDRSEGPAQIVSERLQAAISICKGFAEAITKYSHVVNASQSDHLELRSDIKNYLSYHLEQLEDNKRFAEQKHQAGTNTKFETPRSSYPTWVHTVGAGHVSGPFSFSFLVCYMGGSVRGGTDCFSLKQKLVSYRMNWHIGAFCRMYNDYGSIVRDADECNINSVNFPEFFGNGGGDDELNLAKASLHAAAESERECAVDAAEVLYKNLESEGAAGRKIADHLRVYFGCCEQFSDMYITRDVTNRVK
ncbi:hypothetical protein MMC31_000556 [Peltigera leucophlebia]|nr:hypothetical protein [Peltigera leucophlebia]